MTISTIDILKTIVNEVNIHGIEGLKKAKSFFNVVTNEYEYSCIRGYTGEIEQDKNKFSIENFSKAVERFNNPIPKPIVDDEDNCTIEEPSTNTMSIVVITSTACRITLSILLPSSAILR